MELRCVHSYHTTSFHMQIYPVTSTILIYCPRVPIFFHVSFASCSCSTSEIQEKKTNTHKKTSSQTCKWDIIYNKYSMWATEIIPNKQSKMWIVSDKGIINVLIVYYVDDLKMMRHVPMDNRVHSKKILIAKNVLNLTPTLTKKKLVAFRSSFLPPLV